MCTLPTVCDFAQFIRVMRSAGLLIAFAATAAATPIADLESRAIECSNKGLTVRTLQQSVRHPGVFCKWWLNK